MSYIALFQSHRRNKIFLPHSIPFFITISTDYIYSQLFVISDGIYELKQLSSQQYFQNMTQRLSPRSRSNGITQFLYQSLKYNRLDAALTPESFFLAQTALPVCVSALFIPPNDPSLGQIIGR